MSIISIVSFGLLAFTIVEKEPVFILIQRAHSIPFVLFSTNRLNRIHSSENISNLINKMTKSEKEILLKSNNFEKYNHIFSENTESVLEWSFPKGRSSWKKKEFPVEVAIREFEEETIFDREFIKYIYYDNKLSYSVTGSDKDIYKYILFPAEIDISKSIFSEKIKELKGSVKDTRIIIEHNTDETSNIALFGINVILKEPGFNTELLNFIKNNYKLIITLLSAH